MKGSWEGIIGRDGPINTSKRKSVSRSPPSRSNFKSIPPKIVYLFCLFFPNLCNFHFASSLYNPPSSVSFTRVFYMAKHVFLQLYSTIQVSLYPLYISLFTHTHAHVIHYDIYEKSAILTRKTHTIHVTKSITHIYKGKSFDFFFQGF